MASVIVDNKEERVIQMMPPAGGRPMARQRRVMLDSLECPYAWPAYLRGEWLEELPGVALNRYPDPDSLDLKAALRQTFHLPDEAGVVVGNGSDELIQMINLALRGEGRKVLAPVPGFSMFERIAAYTGMGFVGVPLRADDFALDMPAMLAAIEAERPAVIYLAYPNNPTGNLFAAADVEQLAAASDALVVVDESCLAYSGATLLDSLVRHPNLLILRSLSKIGLAGLRLGYLVGQREWIESVEAVRLPFNINVLTQFTAEFALGYHEVLLDQVAQLCDERERLAQGLAALPGVELFPSSANFLLFRVAGRGDALHRCLQQQGVWLNNPGQSHALLRDCLRVTIGRPADNDIFLAALEAAL